jgi:hypothetical protein
VGTTLALSHSHLEHDHADCSAVAREKVQVATAADSHGRGCRHAHKHQHSSADSHSRVREQADAKNSSRSQRVPADSSLPCRHDDCSLCQFLGLPHSTPPSVTVVNAPVGFVVVAEAIASQCELLPAVSAATPRAPPQCVDASC